MRSFSFRKREITEQIWVVLKDLNHKELRQLHKQCRQQGELDIGYHLLLHNEGLMENARDIEAIAHYTLSDNETSIYVLADDLGRGKLSEAQAAALNMLSRQKGVQWQIREEE